MSKTSKASTMDFTGVNHLDYKILDFCLILKSYSRRVILLPYKNQKTLTLAKSTSPEYYNIDCNVTVL